MKKIALIAFGLFALTACTEQAPATTDSAAPAEDNHGIGVVNQVDVHIPLNAAMVARGEAIYRQQCAACHTLDDSEKIGPGWAGLTSRRTPEWIMNMATNSEVMVNHDPHAKALAAAAEVKMPDQGLSVSQARDVLEFIYANDGNPVGE